MSNRKSFRPIIGVLALGGIFPLLCGVFAHSINASKQSQNPTRQLVRLNANEPNYDFSGESAVPSDKLDVSIVSSNVTTLCHSITITFSTGGQGFQDTSYSFLIAPTDETFTTFYKEFNQWTNEYKAEVKAQAANGEYETPHFTAIIYSMEAAADSSNLYIPATLSRDVFFTLDVLGVRSGAVKDWTGISDVYIPSSVEDLYIDSFDGVGAGVKFHIEGAEVNPNWAEGWNHSAEIVPNAEYPAKKHDVKSAAGAPMYGDENNNYIIGWYPQEGTQYPLVAEYKTRKVDGTLSELRYFTFEKSKTTATTSHYDAVGYQLLGYTNSLYADIILDNPGESIDLETFKLHNIFDAVKPDGAVNYQPDTTHPYSSIPHKSFSTSYNLTDFVTYQFTGISTFHGYTAVDINMDQSGVEAYKLVKSNFYKQYEPAMHRGTAYLRYRITSLNSCYYVIQYKDGGEIKTERVKISTPVSQFVLTQKTNNPISFMLRNDAFGKRFDAKSIYSLSFEGFYVTLDIFAKTETSNGPVARSNFTARFGYVAIMPAGASYSTFDANLLIFLLIGIYTVAYIAAAVVLFFRLREKYKNDEFRRMKPKSYIIKAILGLLGSLIVILAVTFIILRFTALNNAIVVFNPVDAYIIVLGVLSVLVIGYFIKYLVTAYKANKERKRTIRLKLNEDVVDDGTK